MQQRYVRQMHHRLIEAKGALRLARVCTTNAQNIRAKACDADKTRAGREHVLSSLENHPL